MVSPYSFSVEEEDDIYRYLFITRQGIKYSVYFTVADAFFGLHTLPVKLAAHGFITGITKMGEHEEVAVEMDIRVRITISAILIDFLTSNPKNILFLHYDDYDSKQLKRYNCFHKWFCDYNSGTFYKEDTDLFIGTTWVNKLSLIIHDNHPDKEVILQEFHEIKNKLISEK